MRKEGGRGQGRSDDVPRQSLSPITHEYDLRCTAKDAFNTYANRIGEWWDPRYTANAETLLEVTIEPRVGGRVFATHRDIGRDDWGEVIVWEPGRRLAHTFTLAQGPRHPSEVLIEFAPTRAKGRHGCTVRFIHGGWNQANARSRGKFSDWRIILDRFAALANRAGGRESRGQRPDRSRPRRSRG